MEKSIQIYNKKLDNYFDSNGKLLQYPSKKPMRIIVLIKIVRQMEENRKYTEKAVRENGQVIYKARSIRITHNFSPETMKGENLGQMSYRM